jgi:hypothetical protein
LTNRETLQKASQLNSHSLLKFYFGIDPGRKGGLALIDENRNVLFIEAMPLLGKGYDYGRIQSLIDNLPDNTTILLELKPGVWEKSASPTTSFGFHCGVLYGLCLKQNTLIISPKTWKDEFDINRNYKEKRNAMKLRSVHVAEHLFHKEFKSTEDGLAEALLLAEYGRRNRL